MKSKFHKGIFSPCGTLSEWEFVFESQNSSEGGGLITFDKFGGKNFNLHISKLKMVLAIKDLWSS